MKMTTLYLIVARAGSKRLPGKNLKQINSVSLLGYKCLAAKKSERCTDVIISTDSPQIAEEARQYGVSVPFIRPDDLATDRATTEDVVRHAIQWCESAGTFFDAIHLLEPTSPFVRPQDYDAAVELMMIGKDVQFVCGQVLYLFRWDYLKSRKDLYDRPEGRLDFVMPAQYEVDIDTAMDFAYAEGLANDGRVDLSWATP